MLALLSGIYLLGSNRVFAAPITNSTALHNDVAPPWVDGPRERGTWQILYSCLFTLLLCVYSANHLNVPMKGETIVGACLRKTKWAIVAVFAPELVVYTAFEQWYRARKFLKELKLLALSSTDEKFKEWYDRDPKDPPFNMAYAHYVLMGGFATLVDDIHNVLDRVTLTAQGVLFFAQEGYFCRINPSDIEDKSKADVLAKGLVCVQVLWLVGQAIERKIAGLPITLIEAHTMVHVVCALFMYASWYQKPLNVQSPTLLDFGRDRELVAFALELSAPGIARVSKPSTFGETTAVLRYILTRSGYISEPGFSYEYDGEKIQVDPTIYLHRPGGVKVCLHESRSDQIPSIYKHCVGKDDFLFPRYLHLAEDAPMRVEYVPAKGEPVCTLISGQCLGPNIGFASRHQEACRVSLTHKDIKRVALVESAWYRLQQEAFSSGNGSQDAHLVHLNSEISQLLNISRPLIIRSSNVTFSAADNLEDYLLIAALSILPIAYGGVHLSAIGVGFPTTTEKFLWKLSSCYLIAVAGFIGLIYFIRYILGFIQTKLRTEEEIKRRDWSQEFWDVVQLPRLLAGSTIQKLVAALIVLGYVLARLYLVVESFVSLRHVPIGVYQVPDLNVMGNIPHL